MIGYLKHMAIFSAVAEEGSFSEAAKLLGIAPSRVSEAVSRLEDYFDTTLLNRTTRKVTLTSEGRTLYAYTSSMIFEAQAGVNALNDAKASPSGTLRVSVPSYLTRSPVLAAVGAFGAKYPDVHVEMSFHDRHVDPITDGYDMVIRSNVDDLRGRVEVQKIGELERAIVVGRNYYDTRTSPQHPKDLESWDWVTYGYKHRKFRLVARDGKTTDLSVTGARLQVDNLDALHFLAKQNLGVTVAPLEICRDSIEDGSLLHLFGEWRISKVRYFAAWPEKTKRTGLTSMFVAFLSDALGSPSR